MRVRDLRAAGWTSVPDEPGVYWWYFPETALERFEITRWCRGASLRLRRTDDSHACLYHGMAKSLSQRIEWHSAQKLTLGALRSGFLSTLRFTLLALNGFDYLVGAAEIDRFMDGLDVVWRALPSVQDAEAMEKTELAGPFRYPLNIQGNRHSDLADYIRHLKRTRKAYKQRFLGTPT